MKWLHCLRGHRIRRVYEMVDSSTRGTTGNLILEKGWIRRGVRCGCGKVWWD